MKIIKSIDDKRLQSSFYEKLIDISTFLLKKKLFNFYTNIVSTIRLSNIPKRYFSITKRRNVTGFTDRREKVLLLHVNDFIRVEGLEYTCTSTSWESFYSL